MLNIKTLPYGPFICIAVISLVSGMSSMIQFFVLIDLLTHMTEHICSWLCNLLDGKTGLKFVGIQIALNVVVYGSFMSIILKSLLTFSLIISKCAFSDLLRLIWKILRLSKFSASSCVHSCCSGIGKWFVGSVVWFMPVEVAMDMLALGGSIGPLCLAADCGALYDPMVLSLLLLRLHLWLQFVHYGNQRQLHFWLVVLVVVQFHSVVYNCLLVF